MIQSHGRNLRKLRIQLCDACNFRCTYCMPLKPVFAQQSSWLKAQEIYEICSRLQKLGVEEMRLTGGEPLLRKDFPEIITLLSQIPLKKLGLTTNGYYLEKYFEDILQSNIQHLNISLDSLHKDKFNTITRTQSFDQVMRGIMLAVDSSLTVKINVVAMKNFNMNELHHYLDFAMLHGLEVRFLEMMKVGQANDKQNEDFISADEILERIASITSFKEVKSPYDNTAIEYITANGARFGIIASETKSFCNQCSRLRLTYNGELRPCLFREDNINLRNLSESDFFEAVNQVAQLKPSERLESIQQDMNVIGG